MNLELNIGNTLSRKVFCASLILLMGMGFSFSGAQADSCRGTADCLICAQQPHRHLPPVQTTMENPGCRPTQQNSTCGFKSAQGAEKIYGIASSARSFNPVRSAIFVSASDEEGQFRISRGLIALYFLRDQGLKTPIYVRNHSLLC